MIVGDIQRLLGVLPAQMSRVIRSLEARDRPSSPAASTRTTSARSTCCLTAAGDKALTEYREYRVRAIADLLRRLPEDDLDDVHGLLDKLHVAARTSRRRAVTAAPHSDHFEDRRASVRRRVVSP